MLPILWMILSLLFVITAIYFTKQQVLQGRYAVLWLSTSSFILGIALLNLYQIPIHLL